MNRGEIIRKKRELLSLQRHFASISGFLVLLLLFTNENSSGQQSSIQVSLLTRITKKATVVRSEGEYVIRSTPQPAWEAGIDYRRRLSRSFSMVAGIRGSAIGRSANFNVPAKEINPAYPDPYPPIKIKDYDINVSIPLLLEKSWLTRPRERAFLQSGLRLHYSLSPDYTSVGNIFFDTNQAAIDVFGLELKTNNNKKPWITFSLGGGYGWVLGNYNILRAGIAADLSFSNVASGTYSVNVPGHPISSGTYKANGSYIGLFASYNFTGANKKALYALDTQRTRTNREQPAMVSNRLNQIFAGNHISIGLSSFACFPAQLEPTTGNYPISASAMPGLSLGITYHANLNEHYSINSGLEASIVGRNFTIRYNRSDFSPPLKESVIVKAMDTYAGELILSVPVSLERRYFISTHTFFQAEWGARLNYSTGSDFDIHKVIGENENGEMITLGEINTYSNNDARPWVSGLLKAGYNKVLKNNNIARLALVSNISLTKFVNGRYSIYGADNSISEGSYSSTGSFLGLSFHYIFTSANHRIRKRP